MVPGGQVKIIQISGTIVPDEARDDWLKGTGGYEAILTRGAFISLRVASPPLKLTPCNTEFISQAELSEELKGKLNAKVKAGVGTPGTSAEIEAEIGAEMRVAHKAGS